MADEKHMIRCPKCKGAGRVEARPEVLAPIGSRWREKDYRYADRVVEVVDDVLGTSDGKVLVKNVEHRQRHNVGRESRVRQDSLLKRWRRVGSHDA